MNKVNVNKVVDYANLLKENELLHSIIKEVRELREQLSYQYYENGFEYDTPMLLKDLDKILDKAGETDAKD